MGSRKVIIVGGGHSIKEGVSKGLWEVIKGHEIWSCNFAYKTMPYPPNKEIFIDYDFLKNNDEDLDNLRTAGTEIIAHAHGKYKYWGMERYITLVEGTRELNKIDANTVWEGKAGLTGTLALSVAINRGYNEIFLLGYDFGTPDIKIKDTHYYQGEISVKSFGVGNPQLYRDPNTNMVDEKVKDYDWFVGKAQIWNVSLISNIQCFPKISYEDFFKKLLTFPSIDDIIDSKK